MGMLLSFSPVKSAKPRPKPSSGTTASIIIFPGIRYERQSGLDRIGQIMAKSKLPKPGPVRY
jgi:hypothetical protein